MKKSANSRKNPLRPHRLCAAVALALGGLLSVSVVQAAAVVPLSSLNGSNGFRLDAASLSEASGHDVSAAGDINGDGIDDLIIGADGADPNGYASGSSYVVFGRDTGGFVSAINLSALDGNSGFRLDGVATNDRSGRSVSAAGDVNGDGVDDLMVGASAADPNGNNSGSSYVLFGRSAGSFSSAIDLSALNGSNGFRLDGVATDNASGNGISAAGDINGDGIDDVVIGASGASPHGLASGSSYVVFGRSAGGFASAINLSTLDGTNGFRADGVAERDFSGFAVSGAGDVNGDGVDDLMIGALGADPGVIDSGSSYVVFGHSAGGFDAVVELSSLNGSNGFRLDGSAPADRSGRALSNAGDINGDGIDDVVIGASLADPNGVRSGSSYVVFGRSAGSFASAINLSTLDGGNGFRLDGAAVEDLSGHSVSAAGDVNGDGVDDLIIGAYHAGPNGNRAGSSYVVYGRRTGDFNPVINLSSLDGGNGFRIDGVLAYDYSGSAVSGAGDINGDGIDDLIIGAYRTGPEGFRYTGSSYVVFGSGKLFRDGFEGGD